MNDLLTSDIEYTIVLVSLLICFVFGLKKRPAEIKIGALAIDKQFSICIKGIACVFILLGHWGQHNNFNGTIPWGISKIVWLSTANIALVWFMFFSGYGLSLKNVNKEEIPKSLGRRCLNIYLPLILTATCSTIVGLLLNFDLSDKVKILRDCLGLWDWYVFCILIFYSLFYASSFIAQSYKINHTIILTIFLTAYFLIAYPSFGPENAHWYRFPWAFLLGHIVAVNKRNSIYVNVICLAALLLCFFFLKDNIMIACSLIAIFLIYIFSVINRKYEYRGKSLIFLGGLSYFFYLSHNRMGYPLMSFIGTEYIIIWITITIIVSFMLKKLYSIINK